jgi:hypothetical protein
LLLFVGKRVDVILAGQCGEDVLSALLLSLGKKGREQSSAEKNRKIYGGNRFRNIKKIAVKHFPIGIGIGIRKIDSKKCPEAGIPNQACV